MGAAIGAILPFAVGKMVSVFPVIVVVLLLTGAEGRGKGLAYLVGMIAGSQVTGTLLLFLTASAKNAGYKADRSSRIGSLILLIVGLAFCYLAYRNLHRARSDGASAPARTPGLFKRLDAFTTRGSLGLGVYMSVIGAVNLAMLASAVITIGEYDLGLVEEEIVLIIFSAVSVALVATPVGAAFAFGPRAERVLTRLKGWLLRHFTILSAIIFLIFGLIFAAKGLVGLLGSTS